MKLLFTRFSVLYVKVFGFPMEMKNEDQITQQAQRPKYDCLLFDLDDTLYPLNSGLANAIDKNIKDYMVEKLGAEPSKTGELVNLLYSNYGTTIAGLRAIGYDIDYEEYYSFVHGKLPYENLKPDPVLRNLLLSLPYRKLIFTNSDKVHTIKALERLGLEDCFEGMICFETLNPIQKSTVFYYEADIKFEGSKSINPTPKNGVECSEIFDIIEHFAQPEPSAVLPETPIICKPSEHAIKLALKMANLNPQRTLFFEDSVRNIQSGKRLGLHTVLVGRSYRVKGADYAMESIHNLKEAVPELWEADIKAQVACPGTEKLAVETSDIA
ncbi:hypothetical protein GmHk_03G007046 [Glycine max]|nr:hypothetical protein JHK85_006871 [Glycine max]KAG5071463.1 hypothetical protein JHK86_006674 [Glycine max]KAH1256988.1 hypothetical protein GmHk_03G007046 [Glycine max]RZC19556.1 putative protein C24B11.05 [Glycine soja]